MKIFLTGATGFVGSRLCRLLVGCDYVVCAALRHSWLPDGLAVQEQVVVGDIDSGTRWGAALHDVDCVVHLAARVHVMEDDSNDPLAEFRRVNVEGTLNLARQAVAAGVNRFVFISSIKVNGEKTGDGGLGGEGIFCETDVPAPQDAYAVSKVEAEQRLMKLAAETGLEVVIIRPPLVYGPGVKANFYKMMCWLDRGVPLPLGAVYNKRSLVALDNLVDLIMTCIEHPAAVNQVFLAGDGEDLSTTELLRRMAKALGRPARLIPVPVKLLEIGAALLGKRAVIQRLCGSLQVDISKAREVLGWTPPVSVDEALEKTAKGYLGRREKTGE
jgi:nucleoside-diphosphate-sugar epimerase